MKNKIILNIVLVYFVVISIVLVLQLYSGSKDKHDTPITETVKLVDRLNNAVVLCDDSCVMLVNKRQTLVDEKNFNAVPVLKDGSFFVPVSFFENAYNAVAEEDKAKKQATIRLDNTAVIFTAGAASARVINNSDEQDIQLEKPSFDSGSGLCIPIDAFCELFEKETFVYNDDMLIISSADENVAFDPTAEAELLQDIEKQVKNLPLVLSEANLKELIGAKNNFFDFNTGKTTTEGEEPLKDDFVLNNSNSNKIAVYGSKVYAVADSSIIVVDSSSDTEIEAGELPMPGNFSPSDIMVYNDMLYIIGDGKDASMPVIEMTFAENDETPSTNGEKIIHGEKLFLLAYSLDDETPVMRRWFYTEGQVVKKQVFDNMLCMAVRKNAFDLVKDNVYGTPDYCDMNKKTDISLETIKYLPEMKDTYFTSVFRFDMADTDKAVDADVFLGAGTDFVLGQNSVTFPVQYDESKGQGSFANLYKINLSNGIFTKGRLDGRLMAIDRLNDSYAAVTEKSGKSVLCTVDPALEMSSELELSLKNIINAVCVGDKAYLTDGGKRNLVIAAFSQVYLEPENDEETVTVFQPQEKAVLSFDGVEYIKPYETSMIGLGKNHELDNAEISMWNITDIVEKTAGDSIGDAGTLIRPVSMKNIVDNEMMFELDLFVNENDVPTEKYNGVYIYNISENNTPVFKGRITHNTEDKKHIVTDAAYLNGKYFTLSDAALMVSADDAELTMLYKKEF